jgi:hypothetical protein
MHWSCHVGLINAYCNLSAVNTEKPRRPGARRHAHIGIVNANLSAGETARAIDRHIGHTYADKCLLGVDVCGRIIFEKLQSWVLFEKNMLFKKKSNTEDASDQLPSWPALLVIVWWWSGSRSTVPMDDDDDICWQPDTCFILGIWVRLVIGHNLLATPDLGA